MSDRDPYFAWIEQESDNAETDERIRRFNSGKPPLTPGPDGTDTDEGISPDLAVYYNNRKRGDV